MELSDLIVPTGSLFIGDDSEWHVSLYFIEITCLLFKHTLHQTLHSHHKALPLYVR